MAKNKPTKPYPTFPLTPHANGQWCKKIRGKIHFFGVWADTDAALKKYYALAGDLHEGRQPRVSIVSGNGITIKTVCNEFLNWQKEKWEQERLAHDGSRTVTQSSQNLPQLSEKNELSAIYALRIFNIIELGSPKNWESTPLPETSSPFAVF